MQDDIDIQDKKINIKQEPTSCLSLILLLFLTGSFTILSRKINMPIFFYEILENYLKVMKHIRWIVELAV